MATDPITAGVLLVADYDMSLLDRGTLVNLGGSHSSNNRDALSYSVALSQEAASDTLEAVIRCFWGMNSARMSEGIGKTKAREAPIGRGSRLCFPVMKAKIPWTRSVPDS